MIEHVDRRMAEWVVSQLGDVVVDHGPPTADEVSQDTVHLYLMDLYPAPTPTGGVRPPQRWTLRYLLTVAAPSMAGAHGLLGKVATAALEAADIEVQGEPVPLELWLALGLAPQPALILQVPMTHQVPRPRAPSVRHPLELTSQTMGRFAGVVLGPGDHPLVGAKVAVPGLGKFVLTDHDGRFVLPGVPTASRRLRVESKGKGLDVDARPNGEPLVIRYQNLED